MDMDILEGEVLPARRKNRNDFAFEIRQLEFQSKIVMPSRFELSSLCAMSVFIVLLVGFFLIQLDNNRIENINRALALMRSTATPEAEFYNPQEYKSAANTIVLEDSTKQLPLEMANWEKDYAVKNTPAIEEKKHSKFLIKRIPPKPNIDEFIGMSNMTFTEAERMLRNQIKGNSKNVLQKLSLADLYSKNSFWNKAEDLYADVCINLKRNSDCLYNLAISLDQQGKAWDALEVYQQALKNSENQSSGFSRHHVVKRILEIKHGSGR